MVETRNSRRGRSASQEVTGPAISRTLHSSPLPPVKTQHSFAYGATGSPSFPRRLRTSPPTEATRVGSNTQNPIEPNATDLERLEEAALSHPVTGRLTRYRAQKSASPTRRVRGRRRETRESTPEDQLLDSLREASEEAEEPRDKVLPSIEESSVSWNTERYVIGDPRGVSVSVTDNTSSGGSIPNRLPRDTAASIRPIAVPPIRPSGRSQLPPTLQPSEELRFKRPLTASTQLTPELGEIPVLAPPQSDGDTLVPRPVPAPTKTTPSPVTSSLAPVTSGTQKRVTVCQIVWISVFFWLIAFGGTFAVVDDFGGKISRNILLPLCGSHRALIQYTDALNKLSAGVDQRLSEMSREVALLKDEWNKRLPHIKQAIWPAVDESLVPHKINWFSTGVGALVDPYLTTKIRPSLLARGADKAVGRKKTNPPIAALTRWEEHGDCWCVHNHPDEVQLAVLLGRPLVPDEVVIEHIQKEATLEPESAPRDMELWVEFFGRSTSMNSPTAHHEPSPASMKLAESIPLNKVFSEPLSELQRDDILSTLRLVYPNEPETAYSLDEDLGRSFYRIGKFQYNINAKQNIQKFQLDVVIDLPDIRAKKAVVRIKSNWGSSNTCLYRVKLHGHV
ncbi:hypothetical protein LOZ53_000254 [Ophidiomyces ophidiicola]|nr:hypothetical protein LOZ55_003404 [Ophidiomyces ophidiicola]KAI1994404.1 hypothetical protein LOZ51_003592 [Ophidiomyces ophidiicola]KAI1997845.1 hypothetical protein LOZ53_000254 [Ophidiomyces ophidiicola]